MKQNSTKNPKSFNGIYTAVVTPFKDGDIDWSAFQALCQTQVDAGVTGIVIAGTTGESPTLEDSEKVEMIKFARKEFGDALHLMGGSGSNNTKKTCLLSQQMTDAGADSLLVVTPPYNKPSLAGLQLHYTSVAAATDLPICLYHVPGRTGQMLSVEQITTLCQLDCVSMVKEASANMIFFSEAAANSNAEYLSGDDFTFLPSLSIGGKGVVSVLTNVFPKAFVEMKRYFDAGENDKALSIHRAIFDFTGKLFIESNPGPTKFALADLDLMRPEMRAPMSGVTQGNQQKIQKSFRQTLEALQTLGAY